MVACAWWTFQVSQGNVETLFRWGGKRLHILASNLFRKLCTRFHRNHPSFIQDITENMLVSFYRTHCMMLSACRMSIWKQSVFVTLDENQQLGSLKGLESSKCLRERSNTSVPTGTTHVYGNAVPAQKYLWERRSHAFPHHYTPVYEISFSLFGDADAFHEHSQTTIIGLQS